MEIILKDKAKYYSKKSLKLITLLLIAITIIMVIIIAKYKPVYEVTFFGEKVGYITDKTSFENIINDGILNTSEANVADVKLEEKPVYHLKLVSKSVNTNEEEIIAKLDEKTETTYKMYAITLDGENKSYVDTMEEAEEVVARIKEENIDTEINIGITEVYTTNLDELKTVQVADAEESVSKIETGSLEQEIAKKASTLDDVYFSVKPVTGVITSRFGSFESIRSSSHKGIDIGSPNGTPIYAAADGTVSFAADTSGGYGKLVTISHGNDIETYYGHCSKIYVEEGQKVKAGDKIAAVGSTGRSTGNHLHFEIRKNGEQINPQKYVYK